MRCRSGRGWRPERTSPRSPTPRPRSPGWRAWTPRRRTGGRDGGAGRAPGRRSPRGENRRSLDRGPPAFWIVPEEVEKRVLLILIWPDSALSRRAAEAESILTEPVVWAWSVPRKSDTRKRAAVSGEGTRKALWRRPFGGEALLDFEQGLQLDRE